MNNGKPRCLPEIFPWPTWYALTATFLWSLAFKKVWCKQLACWFWAGRSRRGLGQWDKKVLGEEGMSVRKLSWYGCLVTSSGVCHVLTLLLENINSDYLCIWCDLNYEWNAYMVQASVYSSCYWPRVLPKGISFKELWVVQCFDNLVLPWLSLSWLNAEVGFEPISLSLLWLHNCSKWQIIWSMYSLTSIIGSVGDNAAVPSVPLSSVTQKSTSVLSRVTATLLTIPMRWYPMIEWVARFINPMSPMGRFCWENQVSEIGKKNSILLGVVFP